MVFRPAGSGEVNVKERKAKIGTYVFASILVNHGLMIFPNLPTGFLQLLTPGNYFDSLPLMQIDIFTLFYFF